MTLMGGGTGEACRQKKSFDLHYSRDTRPVRHKSLSSPVRSQFGTRRPRKLNHATPPCPPPVPAFLKKAKKNKHHVSGDAHLHGAITRRKKKDAKKKQWKRDMDSQLSSLKTPLLHTNKTKTTYTGKIPRVVIIVLLMVVKRASPENLAAERQGSHASLSLCLSVCLSLSHPGRNSQLTTLAVRRSKMMRCGNRSPHVKMWHRSDEMPACAAKCRRKAHTASASCDVTFVM